MDLIPLNGLESDRWFGGLICWVRDPNTRFWKIKCKIAAPPAGGNKMVLSVSGTEAHIQPTAFNLCSLPVFLHYILQVLEYWYVYLVLGNYETIELCLYCGLYVCLYILRSTLYYPPPRAPPGCVRTNAKSLRGCFKLILVDVYIHCTLSFHIPNI